jgi:tetratricopeptide (TPR) repeat protein
MADRGFRKVWRRGVIFGVLLILWQGSSPAAEPARTNAVTVLEIENQVEIRRAGSQDWDKASTDHPLRVGDRGRTSTNSRATLLLHDSTVVRVGPDTEFQIEAPSGTQKSPLLNLWHGLLYFFGRDKPMEGGVRTPAASAAIRGTEFVLRHDGSKGTILTLLDGEVLLRDLAGRSVTLNSREEGSVRPGQPPVKTAVISAANVVQWCLYYPGVLDLGELQFTPREENDLVEALAAYRNGDLLQALAVYPAGRQPESDSARVFLAALLVAVGNVESAESVLAEVIRGGNQDRHAVRLASALGKVLVAVKQQSARIQPGTERSLTLATEWLAESYSLQSQARLKEARVAARKATEISPEFGFAWTRLAELEFSFGRAGAADEALDEGLRLAPRNAQAMALRGFLLAARNKPRDALKWFDRAIAVDGALGNAWLGRGLCRIRRGDKNGGCQDLLIAAALEPQRSLLRSYLGKAWAENHDEAIAAREFALAQALDPNDPTPWLYSAILNEQLNRLNTGVEDLEKSVELNGNRSVFRSKLLLDEDRAVRSTSLASIYRENGMYDVSLREATRAVTSDYANYSGHLFLANSYDGLRDPTRFNLRYETPWFNELLLANLLAPVGVAAISPNISQQEYSRMFEQDGLGLASTTDMRSDGQYREVASQYGAYRWFSYSLDLDWQHNEGVRPNNELDRTEWYSQFKFQVTPQDSLLVLTKYQDYHSGDNFQYYDPGASYRPDFAFDETQKPIVIAAYHREWAPGIHTLALGGRLVNDQHISDAALPVFVFSMSPTGTVESVRTSKFDVSYGSQFVTWISELNQIIQSDRNTLILGGRFQAGDFDTANSLTNVTIFSSFFPPVDSAVCQSMQRWSVYGYDTVEAVPARLWLTAGLCYDHLEYPENFRQVPISAGETRGSCLGPKAALVWNPAEPITVRGAYAHSLGGVSLDESYRLEPAQLAGFNQSFRTIMSESIVGSVSAPEFRMAGAAVDLKFRPGTYIGLVGEVLGSDVDRNLGVYRYPSPAGVAFPSATPQELCYDEYSAAIVVNQLLSRDWSLGASYRFTRSELQQTLPEVPVGALPDAQRINRSDLHVLACFVLYSHPSGFFARGDLSWYFQENLMYTDAGSVDLPDDNFPQLNLWLGLRLRRSLGDMSIGLLNVTGQDYHLNPLNPYMELPRERAVAARLRLRF